MPDVFPAPVLTHALARPLIPPTPRRAVEGYWNAHPIRADRLARGLARLSGAPVGWRWEPREGVAVGLRAAPAPYREAAFARGPGFCCVCGQPVFRLGWHRDLWGEGKVNRNASWHSACVVAWKLWHAPSDHIAVLKRRQRHRCAQTGKRLLRAAEVDHRVPLFQVRRDLKDALWPELLGFWGVPNLQVINREAHVSKCAFEAAGRAQVRADARCERGRRDVTAATPIPSGVASRDDVLPTHVGSA